MLPRLQAKLTYANVMSTMAVFLVLGGVAWAAALPRNSVGTRQLKGNAVTSAKIKNGQVKTADVANDDLTGADVLESSLTKVPSAAAADTAGSAATAGTANRANSAAAADSATRAATATNADNATNAANAQNAGTIEGVPLDGIVVAGSDNAGGCNPQSATFVQCASATIELTRTSRLLVVADVQWHTEGDTAPSEGNCEVRVNGLVLGENMFIGEKGTAEATDAQHERGAGVNFTTTNRQPGTYTASIHCNEDEPDLDLDEASISAIAVAPTS